jgi:hypothetical protein
VPKQPRQLQQRSQRRPTSTNLTKVSSIDNTITMSKQEKQETESEKQARWAKEDEQKEGESQSEYARRLQDNAENRGVVTPAITVEGEDTLVRKTPDQKNEDAENEMDSSFKRLNKTQTQTKK